MKLLKKLLTSTVVFSLVGTFLLPSHSFSAVSSVLNLPAPGSMISLTSTITPPLVQGMTIYPEDPLKFSFIIDPGSTSLTDSQFEVESTRIIKYFLASLTTPEEDLWVNLSPYEKNRIIAASFGETEMGRDLLAQDYILKQLTSSLMYPERELGKKFWNQVYAKVEQKFGKTRLPTNTFNKVWIVPSKAEVWEHGNSAYVTQGRLKVLLEQDYTALRKNMGVNVATRGVSATGISTEASSIVRDVILPEIEREVNEGAHFAQLRQIYNALILATWYKQNLRESILGQVYVNQNKTPGVDVADKGIKQKIYDQYLQAFKKGAYNYIKEDKDPVTLKPIARKYFSGGANLNFSMIGGVKTERSAAAPVNLGSKLQNSRRVDWRGEQVQVRGKNSDSAMLRNVAVIGQRGSSFTGADTGSDSMEGYQKAGATGMIIGHSETRERDSDKAVHKQVLKALELGLDIILAVGETEEERNTGKSYDVVQRQVRSAIEGLSPDQLKKIAIAYEPRWAITGSGKGVAALPGDAQEMHRYIRNMFVSPAIRDSLEILFGGSVSSQNVQGFLEIPEVAGFLVGSKSTNVNDFMPILQAAAIEGNRRGKAPHVIANWKTYSMREAPADFLKGVAAINRQYGIDNLRVSFSPSSLDFANFVAELKEGRKWLNQAQLANYEEVKDVPEALTRVLDDQGFNGVKKLEVATLLSGRGVNLRDLLYNNTGFLYALGTALNQSFGSRLFAGMGKEAKDVADNTGLQLNHEMLMNLTGTDRLMAVANIGSEGIRDQSKSTPMGRIYWAGFKDGFLDTNGDHQTFVAHITKLRALGVNVYYSLNDVLENTNALKDNEKDPWAASALRKDDPTRPVPSFLNEEDLRRVSVVANFERDLRLEATDLPEEVFFKIAKANNIDATDEAALKKLGSTLIMAVLGPRKDEDIKKSSNKRHIKYLDQIANLEKKYGVVLMKFGDGDLMPGLLAATGIKLDGRQVVKFGRTGLVEAEMIDWAGALLQRRGAQFASRLVSNKETNALVDPTTMDKIEPGLLRKLSAEFGKDTSKFLLQRTQKDLAPGLNSAIGMTAILGADQQRYFGDFAEQLPAITFDHSNGTATAVTFIISQEGVFAVRATLQSDDLIRAKDRLVKASPDGEAFVQKNKDKFPYTQYTEVQDLARMDATIDEMVDPTGAVIALDESEGTAGSRLKPFGLENNSANRGLLRQMFMETEDLYESGIHGAIADRDTFRNVKENSTKKGVHLIRHLRQQGIKVGLKTDGGQELDTRYPKEWDLQRAKGGNVKVLADLEGLLKELGPQADFTKWRATFDIVETADGLIMPFDDRVKENTHENIDVLVQQALITQKYGLPPMVEPENLFEKRNHRIRDSFEASTYVWRRLFRRLGEVGVDIGRMVLKTNMITPGQLFAPESEMDSERVADLTLQGLLMEVPSELPAIVFLSGGMQDDVVNRNYNAIKKKSQDSVEFIRIRDTVVNRLESSDRRDEARRVAKLTAFPWRIGFSFSRGLEQQALTAWKGKSENVPAAQEAMRKSAQTTQRAHLGVLAASQTDYERALQQARMRSTIRTMVDAEGAVVAWDESEGTAGSRLKPFGLENNPANRGLLRQMFMETEGLYESGIHGAIADRDTFRNVKENSTKNGVPLIKHLRQQRVKVGLKTDGGQELDARFPKEWDLQKAKGGNDKVLADLGVLLTELGSQADFTKWRATFDIVQTGTGEVVFPDDPRVIENTNDNIDVLARQARITQDFGLPPMVEPENLFEKRRHSIEQGYKASSAVWRLLFAKLKELGVDSEHMILKTNMVTPGQNFAKESEMDSERVAWLTLKGLLKEVDSKLPAIVFLSGGQQDDVVNRNYNAIKRMSKDPRSFFDIRSEVVEELRSEGRSTDADRIAALMTFPWRLGFSFSRGLEQQALTAWQGKSGNVPAAQKAMRKSARTTQAAHWGVLDSFLGATNSAMSNVDRAQYGGIDLDTALMQMQVKRDGKTRIQYNPAMIQNIRIDGIRPVILNIDSKPINVNLLLGDAEKSEQKLSLNVRKY